MTPAWKFIFAYFGLTFIDSVFMANNRSDVYRIISYTGNILLAFGFVYFENKFPKQKRA